MLASAQSTDQSTTGGDSRPTSSVVHTQTPRQDNKWGWIVLAGLAGLPTILGSRRKPREWGKATRDNNKAH